MDGVIYECDPALNKNCRKRGCYINGFECRATTNIEYSSSKKIVDVVPSNIYEIMSRKEKEMELYKVEKPLTVMKKTIWAADVINIGDQIEVSQYTATCQKSDENGALFLLDQYLDEARPMNNKSTNKGGYEESDLRKWLNSDDVLGTFAQYEDRMKPFENGDLLRLPYFGELFGWEPGDDSFFERDPYEQWPLMKTRANRVAYRCNDWEWGWLANKAVRSATAFALVHTAGLAAYNGASYALGVRPAFLLI